MDPMLEAAKKKRADLVQELEKIDHFLETYRALTLELRLDEANKDETSSPPAGVETSVDRERMEVARAAEGADEAPPKRIRVSDNPPQAAVIEAAIELIRATGRPMSRREVREGLAARGVVVNGVDPVKTMGTILWRAPEQITQVEGRGYWPKADPVPQLTSTDTFGDRPLRAAD